MHSVLFQCRGIQQFNLPVLSDSEYCHLLESLKLLIRKPPDREICKVIHQHAADIRGQAIVWDDIDTLLSPLDCLPAKAGGAVNGGAKQRSFYC